VQLDVTLRPGLRVVLAAAASESEELIDDALASVEDAAPPRARLTQGP
jgi:hypothetical protein